MKQRHSWASALSGLAFVLMACGPPGPPENPSTSNIAESTLVDAPAPAKPAAATAPGATNAPGPTGPAPKDANAEAATAAAQSWLALVDAQKYAESWSGAAKAFQGAVSSENWSKAVSGVRRPLGKVLSRQLKSAEFKTSLPGAPDGKYVVIQFATVFEKKAQAVETITPSQEADGSWKVSGYFIK